MVGSRTLRRVPDSKDRIQEYGFWLSFKPFSGKEIGECIQYVLSEGDLDDEIEDCESTYAINPNTYRMAA
jgi:hypothetical protein